jgi:hypothetical protein
MTIELVIAKYNEDVSWTKKIKHKITIYDKSENPIENSIPLENIGKESNTFLYHISNNYDYLYEKTIFLQGDPLGHLPHNYLSNKCFSLEEFIHFLNELEIKKDNYTSHLYNGFWLGPVTKWRSPECDPWFTRAKNKNIFLNFPEYKNVSFAYGAQYLLPKNILHSRPKNFWQKLYEMSKTNLKPDDNSNKIDPWTFEILWPLIYDPTYEINPEFYKL